jgi:hypothetical protein
MLSAPNHWLSDMIATLRRSHAPPRLVLVFLVASPVLAHGQTPDAAPPPASAAQPKAQPDAAPTSPAQSGAAPAGAAQAGNAAGKAKATAPLAKRPPASKAKPPTTLEVVVLDPRGEPVSGAVVAVSTRREAMPRPHSGRTGARGSVKLEKLPRPPWDVAVQARGLAPKRIERVLGQEPLRVRLAAGAVLSGVVKDGTTREPVAGATVWHRPVSGPAVTSGIPMPAACRRAPTRGPARGPGPERRR